MILELYENVEGAMKNVIGGSEFPDKIFPCDLSKESVFAGSSTDICKQFISNLGQVLLLLVNKSLPAPSHHNINVHPSVVKCS